MVLTRDPKNVFSEMNETRKVMNILSSMKVCFLKYERKGFLHIIALHENICFSAFSCIMKIWFVRLRCCTYWALSSHSLRCRLCKYETPAEDGYRLASDDGENQGKWRDSRKKGVSTVRVMFLKCCLINYCI